MAATTSAEYDMSKFAPAPSTFAPSRKDVLSSLAFFFGDPASPEKLRDYSEHHAATCKQEKDSRIETKRFPPKPSVTCIPCRRKLRKFSRESLLPCQFFLFQTTFLVKRVTNSKNSESTCTITPAAPRVAFHYSHHPRFCIRSLCVLGTRFSRVPCFLCLCESGRLLRTEYPHSRHAEQPRAQGTRQIPS